MSGLFKRKPTGNFKARKPKAANRRTGRAKTVSASQKAPSPAPVGPRTGRMAAVFVTLMLALTALVARAWFLQVHRHDHFAERGDNQHRAQFTLRGRRGNIFDREGRQLAITADGYSVFVVRSELEAPDAVAHTLAKLLKLDPAPLIRRFSEGKGFAWVKRHITPEARDAVVAANLPGVGIREEPRRFYPNRALAGALIGFAGIDGVGLEGVERDLDRWLKGRRYALEVLRDATGRRVFTDGLVPMEQQWGHHVTLTLDARIQQVAEESLAWQVREMDARGGVAVVMDPRTGDVLALAQTPAFDPNLYRTADSAVWRLRAITDVLEPGSTVKPLLIAAAMDAGAVRPNTVFDGHKGRLRIGRRWIRDVHREEQFTTLEIVQKSSNVGAVQVAQRAGRETLHSYLRAFGFGERTGIGLKGEQGGVLRPARKWGLAHLATHAYGYGFNATPLQMATAFSALANGGVLMRPRLIKQVTDARNQVVEAEPPRSVRRVISEKTARQVKKALVMVTSEGGTGRKARVPGFVVAGKTGTAHKADKGGYSKERVISSFAGFVPAQDPRLVIYVAIDEPKNARYGGVVAGPVFKEIARETLAYLGVRATEPFDPEEVASVGEAEAAEGLDPQARPWWLADPTLAGDTGHVVVPDLKGMPISEVIKQAAGLERPLEIDGAGLVVRQQPQAGALLAPDQPLLVTLALPGAAPARPGEVEAQP